MKLVITLLGIYAAVLLGGCNRDVATLSEEEIARHVPDTIRRVDRLREVPKEVVGSVASDLGLRELRDRRAYWTGGCDAGARLLQAGERKEGWWLFYELGGIVDSKRLALIQSQDGKFRVISTTILR
jgi:hypothetical protein